MGKKLWQSVEIRIGFFCKYRTKKQKINTFYSSSLLLSAIFQIPF